MTAGQPPEGDPEVDWSWTDDETDWIPPDIDTDRPSPARMYDFALGGKDNFAVDRAAVAQVGAIVPDFRSVALANRGFLVRAVRALTELGVDQFIDAGSGLPTSPNVHDIAQQVQPGARVVYVDNDPIVAAHNRALRASRPGVITIDEDLRHPHRILDHPAVREHLDLTRPVGLLFVAVLHFVRHELAVEAVARYRRALAPGSFLAISTACSEGMEPALIDRLERVYAASPTPFVLRSPSQVEHLFEGTEVLEPGLVDVNHWRSSDPLLPIRIHGGVGRVR